ncbi:DUF6550 family protein [Sinanaerobacter chloroacetimidivorans]|uniref:Uncharacterized protein n=1 Tax=Sinanaerobacter chloroacetimidivorans TaxID=2818044 RepID=A0A8J8B0Z4_9FIRM|nr:DUF6550 family protein [Sinanaerobacter chloroacetimidivorans]MBR0597684.1 hypothetical protein [Sinanaerobacter chloroacetimidivorans]
MKNISDKTQKRLAIAGCLAACVVLAVLIGSRFIPEKSAEQPLPSQNSQSSQVTVNTDAEKGKEVVVVTPNTSQPAITENGADSTGTDQKIQGDVSKPPAPSKEQLTDPSQKPNSSANTESSNGTSTDGSSQSGGGLPGFDNVPNGGPNQGETVDGDGDINKQVGEM